MQRSALVLALAGTAAAFSPMMSMDTGRRQVVQAGAAAAVAAPLLRANPAEAKGAPMVCCTQAHLLESAWACGLTGNVPQRAAPDCFGPCHAVEAEGQGTGHHHIRSPRVPARWAKQGVLGPPVGRPGALCSELPPLACCLSPPPHQSRSSLASFSRHSCIDHMFKHARKHRYTSASSTLL